MRHATWAAVFLFAGMLGAVPIHFEPNHLEPNLGPSSRSTPFLARGPGFTLLLEPGGVELLPGPRPHRRGSIRMTLRGANSNARLTGLDPLPGKSNYLLGNNPAQWTRSVPHFRKVAARGVYPGIDLVYYGQDRDLEHDFIVAPGADPSRIRLNFEGARSPRLDANGDLLLDTPHGVLRQKKPVMYQGDRQLIDGGYIVRGREVSFRIARYDRTRPLIIDPVTLYSTYLGGDADDWGFAIASDDQGNAYIAGHTASPNFPVARGFRSTYSGGPFDIYVSKISPDGSTLVWSTYLGGSGDDQAFGIAVDRAGNVYVAGGTSSLNFPASTNLRPPNAAGLDALVAKLRPDGSGLVYATVIGGNLIDVATSIAIDRAGSAHIAGISNSVNFPTSPSGQQTNTGDFDAFTLKLNPAGTAFVFSTLIGGSLQDLANGIALDSSGAAYVVGLTRSTNFPVSPDAIQPNKAAGSDAFIFRVTYDQPALLYSTFYGGAGDDHANGVTLDANNRIWFVGQTASRDFPLRGARSAPYNGGPTDAFIAIFNVPFPAMTLLTADKPDSEREASNQREFLGVVDVSLFGGLGADSLYAIKVQGSQAVAAGDTTSALPSMGILGNCGGMQAEALTLLLNAGTMAGLPAAWGCSGRGTGLAAAFGGMGNILIGGTNLGGGLATTTGALQRMSGGLRDATIIQITDVVPSPMLKITKRGTVIARDEVEWTIDVTNEGPGIARDVIIEDNFSAESLSENPAAKVTFVRGPNCTRELVRSIEDPAVFQFLAAYFPLALPHVANPDPVPLVKVLCRQAAISPGEMIRVVLRVNEPDLTDRDAFYNTAYARALNSKEVRVDAMEPTFVPPSVFNSLSAPTPGNAQALAELGDSSQVMADALPAPAAQHLRRKAQDLVPFLTVVQTLADSIETFRCPNGVCVSLRRFTLPQGSRPIRVAAADLDRDGRRDLITLNFGAGAVTTFLSTAPASPVTSPVGSRPSGFATYTVAGSVRLAVVRPGTDSNQPGSVTIFQGSSQGAFAPLRPQGSSTDAVYPVGRDPFAVVAADLNNDAVVDLAVANTGSDTVTILLGDSNGGFRSPESIPVGRAPTGLVTGDWNADRVADLAVAASASSEIVALTGSGGGAFTVSSRRRVRALPMGLVTDDFNGDGNPDLAASCFLGQSIDLLFGSGDGGFSQGGSLGAGLYPALPGVTDFNEDGRPDLAVPTAVLSRTAILLNQQRVAAISSASLARGGPLAPDSIASAFGENLARELVVTEVPLPTQLAGVRVEVIDSRGTRRAAPLFFVAPSQVNFLLPAETSAGPVQIQVNTAGQTKAGTAEVSRVAPGIYTANASGSGPAAAFWLRAGADGSRTQELTFDPGTLRAMPIDLGGDSDQVFLLLFGTGIRGFTGQVTASAGGLDVPVLGAVPQGQFPGLDQVNIGPLPRPLAGRGEVAVILTVDGTRANTATVNIR